MNVNLDTEELFLDDDVITVKRSKGGTLGDDDVVFVSAGEPIG